MHFFTIYLAASRVHNGPGIKCLKHAKHFV